LIAVPFATLGDLYAPVAIDELLAPGLVPHGQTVESVGVAALLAVDARTDDLQRARRIARLIDRLGERLPALAEVYPVWREINPSARVPGWTWHPLAAAVFGHGSVASR
jgi:hypothetical protein